MDEFFGVVAKLQKTEPFSVADDEFLGVVSAKIRSEVWVESEEGDEFLGVVAKLQKTEPFSIAESMKVASSAAV